MTKPVKRKIVWNTVYRLTIYLSPRVRGICLRYETQDGLRVLQVSSGSRLSHDLSDPFVRARVAVTYNVGTFVRSDARSITRLQPVDHI